MRIGVGTPLNKARQYAPCGRRTALQAARCWQRYVSHWLTAGIIALVAVGQAGAWERAYVDRVESVALRMELPEPYGMSGVEIRADVATKEIQEFRFSSGSYFYSIDPEEFSRYPLIDLSTLRITYVPTAFDEIVPISICLKYGRRIENLAPKTDGYGEKRRSLLAILITNEEYRLMNIDWSEGLFGNEHGCDRWAYEKDT